MSDEPGADATPAPVRCACPADARIARHFDGWVAGRHAGRDEMPLAGTSERLLAQLLAAGPAGRSVLELGCGAAGLLLRLVQAGAVTGSGVDLSPAALTEARRRAERADLAERVRFVLGDAADVPLERHDWVILDRVICCYPDCSALVDRAIAATASLIAFSAPDTRGWRGLLARAELLVERIVDRFQADPCPSFLHDLAAVQRSLEAAGFRSRHQSGWRSWRIAVYERAPLGTSDPAGAGAG